MTQTMEAPKSGKMQEIISSIETMSVLELSDLVKALEEKFGVSAAAPVAAPIRNVSRWLTIGSIAQNLMIH